jgi:hypothetical protein
MKKQTGRPLRKEQVPVLRTSDGVVGVMQLT